MQLPNQPAANKVRLGIWIDRGLLERFRAVVPRGQQQDRIRDLIQAEVERLKNGRAEETEGGG